MRSCGPALNVGVVQSPSGTLGPEISSNILIRKYKKKTGQARVGFAHRGFRTKIGGLSLFSEIQA